MEHNPTTTALPYSKSASVYTIQSRSRAGWANHLFAVFGKKMNMGLSSLLLIYKTNRWVANLSEEIRTINLAWTKEQGSAKRRTCLYRHDVRSAPQKQQSHRHKLACATVWHTFPIGDEWESIAAMAVEGIPWSHGLKILCRGTSTRWRYAISHEQVTKKLVA